MANILLGVSGGIAVYKSCELVREFQRRGHTVQVILTPSAQQFVTPLTFEALTKKPVFSDLFGDGAFGTAHIDVARWADVFVVAPLTANSMANFVHGNAPEFLSTVYLAFKKEVYVAPAMNSAMWEHPATRENLSLLQKRGVNVISPIEGELACGEVGIGKMAEPASIAKTVCDNLEKPKSLSHKKVLITSGATREYIDPVRFLSNPSTGKMGMALAAEAHRRGAEVVLVHANHPQEITLPVKCIAVGSAKEMLEAVLSELPAEIFIGSAAVTDYSIENIADQKQKKKETLELSLKKNEDVVRTVSTKRRTGDKVVGFAAETENLIPNSKLKLEEKKLDLVVGNRVHQEKVGFGQDALEAVLLNRKGVVFGPSHLTKKELARTLFDELEKRDE